MSQQDKKTKKHRRLKVWQRLFLALGLIICLAMSSTLFFNYQQAGEDDTARTVSSGWKDPVTVYVLALDDTLTVPFYNEGLAVEFQCGRGTEVEMENWTPFVSEDGVAYYHVFLNGDFGYILCENITDDKSSLLQESQVYVRTSVVLLSEPDGVSVGSLAQKGELLRIIGYDYFTDDGQVNMYEVKMGTEIGWIQSDYVVPTYAEALENWDNDSSIYAVHVSRGDTYGGGDAAELDYWPHTKGDFSADGNVMPESCYALYIPVSETSPEKIQSYLDMAEGTAVNTFVFTISDDGEVAFPSKVLEQYGILGDYHCENTMDEFAEVVQLVKDAGYYTIARITTFKDYVLARAYPEWSITDLDGAPMEINNSYWPSVFCRHVWELKVSLALEAVDDFGFNEIQFDYVRFPDYIINYEEEGTVDLKNADSESKAQAVQRFLIYATDLIHEHGAYVSADVFGETSNTYVAPYGQYWAAISDVVDVISGMPYPDHYNSYYTSSSYYVPYKHPYATINDWAIHVVQRQAECSSPAIVRTWLQTWDDADYQYDELAIQRQIAGLYDAGITGGFMLWHSYGSVEVAENIGTSIDYDYYEIYRQALAAGQTLSVYMNIDTSE